jgi:charged multivesicular body protein 7
VIKFVTSAADEPEEITAVDAGLAELKGGVAGLQAQIDGLQLQIDTHNQKAAEAVRAKRLPAVALSHLRARKHAEEVLQRRIGALDTLRATLLQVETSAGDIEVCHLLRARGC